MTRALILAATLLVATALAETRDIPVAMGNLGVHYNFRKIISTDADPLTATASGPIWCQASLNGDLLPFVNASFIRYKDAQRRRFIPEVNHTLHKASLTIGEVVHDHMGKYRCEIEMSADDRSQTVYGNLFVYSSPFFHTNGSMNMHMSDEANQNVVKADPLRAALGSDFDIHCPAVGFPPPNITWYKKDEVITAGERYRISEDGTKLTIIKVTEEDANEYGCTATNKYPTRLDLDFQDHEASLKQVLRIGSAYGWILPLLVILVTLLLLFIIIYACAACKRYQHDNYNVAKREKRLLRTPSPASSAASTKKYELVSSP